MLQGGMGGYSNMVSRCNPAHSGLHHASAKHAQSLELLSASHDELRCCYGVAHHKLTWC